MEEIMNAIFVVTILLSSPWVEYKSIRDSGRTPGVIADVENHLKAGHVYDDPDLITTVHECTHGINSVMRNQYGCPCFYVLDDGVALIKEPKTDLRTVAATIPISLRGDVYGLYLIQAQTDWNNQPSYVFDEWSAYTNGSDARNQLGIKTRSETVQYMIEFCIYSICVEMSANDTDSNTKEFVEWQLNRCLDIYQESGVTSEKLTSLRTSGDAEDLRLYINDQLSPKLAERLLGASKPKSEKCPGNCPCHKKSPPKWQPTRPQGNVSDIEVVAFTAKWCGPCKKNHPILEQLKSRGIKVIEIDVDDNRDLAEKNNIASVPTYFITRGDITIRTSNPDELRKLLR
jgi:thiol-disulfide isomerase/thioredoxin